MMEKYPQLRFCKILKGSKKPFEKDWTNKLYPFEELNEHIKNGGNYGVLCGIGNLAVIDSDTEELQRVVEAILPKTLRVKTGGGGVHNYFFIPELKNKIILTTIKDGTDKHWGEVQSYGTQVVGHGSVHPNGNEYRIIQEQPIAEISYIELLSAIKPFMRQVQEVQNFANYEKKTYSLNIDDLSVAEIWGTVGLKQQGGEYYGEHPVHGSEGGMNFWINPSKNLWHCFRCNSGGGPLSAIAVKEGIINCSDAQKGYLRAEKAFESIQRAKEKYGPKEPKQEDIIQNANSLKLLNYNYFETMQKDTNFLVDEVIYPKTVTMVYSPPGEFKSLLCLLMGMSVASGKDWMRFKTQQNPVLYCDKENNAQILKDRLMFLFKGENFENKDFPFYILHRQGDLLNAEFISKLKQVIKEKGIKLVFFDTLHRFADYDENKSDDINRIYTNVFQPIVEDSGCSVIFLHHTKKDGGYRGSGDFLGMVDTAYAVYRERNAQNKSSKFRIVNEKCRAGEIENILGEIDFGENYIKILRLNAEVEEDKGLNKLKELTKKIQFVVRAGESIKKKEIEDRLEMEEFVFSPATLKRSLKWLVSNHYLDKNEKGEYSLIIN